MADALPLARDLIRRFEGWSSTPYRDSIGIPTIGYGSIYGSDGKRVTMDHPMIDEAEGARLLEVEALHAMASVARLTTVALSDEQIAALASFTYNLGSGAFQRSTLRARVNRQELEAADEFGRWVYAGGRKLPGLIRRRAAEAEMFLAR